MGGAAVLAVALVGPLDAAAHDRLSAHMVQHLLLTVVAAPLLVLARPHRTLAAVLPHRVRRRLGAWERRASALRPRRRWLAWQVGAASVYGAVLWAWHVPALHEGSLASAPLHAAQHLSLLAAGLALWGVVIAGARSGAEPGAVLALFMASVAGMVLAALLVFAPAAWYPTYAQRAADPAAALVDQQVAGAVMWMPGMAVPLVVAGAIVARGLAGAGRRRPPGVSGWRSGGTGGWPGARTRPG